MFARFFDGGHGQQEKRGPGLMTHLEVDLADLYTGKNVEVSFSYPLHPYETGLAAEGADVFCSFKYREKSYVHIVMDQERIQMRTSRIVDSVEEKGW